MQDIDIAEVGHLDKQRGGEKVDGTGHDSALHHGVGVTKPISSVPLFSELFSIVKTHISYWMSRLYLTGVTAAQLRWHLSNINVIQII